MFQKLCDTIDALRDKAIQFERLLVSVPALAPENGGDGESQKARALTDILREEGFPQPQSYPAPDKRVSSGERPNLAYLIRGRDSSRTVWIMSHLDIVPAGELSLWESSPFQLRIEGDKIIGRGVEDNHHGVVSSLIAAKALIDAKVTPRYDVGILLVADEEVGSAYGVQYLLDTHDLFKENDLIVVPDSGEPTGASIEIAEKSIVWLKIKTKGKQCHGSRPDLGKNAFKAAANLVVRIEELYQMFDAKDPLFEPSISTFEPTKKEPNVPNVNTIPGDDVFYVDCRVLPKYKLDDIEAKVRFFADDIEKKFGVTVEISHVQKGEAASPTSVDAPIVKALAKGIRKVYHVEPKPIGIGGGTVGALIRRKGLPVAVWSTVHESAHQPNEYTFISKILGDAKVFAHVFVEG